MARKKDSQDNPQGVPDEVEELLAKIFAQTAEEKTLREQYYQEVLARIDQAPEEQKQRKRLSHLRLVGREAPATPRETRPRYNPDEEEAYLVELARTFPPMESAVEKFRHRRRFFERLVAARKEAGLTQAEVAKRMSISRSAVERLEIGDGDPRISMIERYAQALGKKIEWRFV